MPPAMCSLQSGPKICWKGRGKQQADCRAGRRVNHDGGVDSLVATSGLTCALWGTVRPADGRFFWCFCCSHHQVTVCFCADQTCGHSSERGAPLSKGLWVSTGAYLVKHAMKVPASGCTILWEGTPA